MKQYPSSGPPGRGQVANRVSTGAIVNEPDEGAMLIGRKVRTRWPDDNNFYEAFISDYNAAEVHVAFVHVVEFGGGIILPDIFPMMLGTPCFDL